MGAGGAAAALDQRRSTRIIGPEDRREPRIAAVAPDGAADPAAGLWPARRAAGSWRRPRPGSRRRPCSAGPAPITIASQSWLMAIASRRSGGAPPLPSCAGVRQALLVLAAVDLDQCIRSRRPSCSRARVAKRRPGLCRSAPMPAASRAARSQCCRRDGSRSPAPREVRASGQPSAASGSMRLNIETYRFRNWRPPRRRAPAAMAGPMSKACTLASVRAAMAGRGEGAGMAAGFLHRSAGRPGSSPAAEPQKRTTPADSSPGRTRRAVAAGIGRGRNLGAVVEADLLMAAAEQEEALGGLAQAGWRR